MLTTSKKAIDQDIERRKIRRVILDMSQVTFIDSSALGVILGRYKKLKTLNGSLEIANAPPNIFRILSMSGLPKIIAFTSDGKEILS